MRISPLHALVATTLLFIATMPAAHAAYVDPGSGLFLLQTLAAGVLGTVFYFRRSLAQLFGFLRRQEPNSRDGGVDADA